MTGPIKVDEAVSTARLLLAMNDTEAFKRIDAMTLDGVKQMHQSFEFLNTFAHTESGGTKWWYFVVSSGIQRRMARCRQRWRLLERVEDEQREAESQKVLQARRSGSGRRRVTKAGRSTSSPVTG